MSKIITLKEKWDLLVNKLTNQFADGDELNMDGIIYLIGVQELGKSHKEYKKDDKAFTSAAKISESEAEKIALEKYNGKIVDREYSMENGNPAYEFDIYVAKKGHEYEVEVDAITGEILEVEMELYDIGSED